MTSEAPPGPAPVVSGGRSVVDVAELLGLAGSVGRWQDVVARSADGLQHALAGVIGGRHSGRVTAGWGGRTGGGVAGWSGPLLRLVALHRVDAAAVGGRLATLGFAIRLAARGYQVAEDTVRRSWALTDAVVGHLAEAAAITYPDRAARIGPLLALPPRPPPTGLAGLLDLVDDPGAPAGRVDVWPVGLPAADRPPTVVVALPGTSSWAPPWAADDRPDIRSLGASLDLLGRRTSAEVAALPDVLAAAGVPDGAQLVLVGHSLGGLTATVAAADPRLRERYHVSHVVTAGSPVGGLPLPPGVRGLALEHRADLVPMLDGHANPGGAGRLTLRFGAARDGPIDDPVARSARGHALEGYRAAAAWADGAGDPDLADLRSSLAAAGVGSGSVRGGTAGLGRRVVLDLAGRE